MSDTDKNALPIVPDSPLGKALDGCAAPALPEGFAERVVINRRGSKDSQLK